MISTLSTYGSPSRQYSSLRVNTLRRPAVKL